MIEFGCKNCGQKLSVQDQYSGKRVKCPKCGSVGVVPDNSDKIKFNCQNCGQSISVPQIHAGKKGKCPKCKNPVVVPSLKREPSDGAGTVSVVCSMCNEAVQVPETSRGKTIECPECGSYIETSSGGALSESDASIPPTTDEDLYQEETEEYEESVGVDRRIIVGISAVAAVVVVGLIVLAVVLRSSGPRQAEGPDGLPMQRQIADTDSRHQPVTPDTQPEEPVEAVPLPNPGDVVTNSIGMKLVYIPAGSFMMGSGDSAAQLTEEYGKLTFAAEFPKHEVRISKGFWMGQTEVTQGQYKSVMNAQPWSGRSLVQEDANSPAVSVRWEDSVEFCRKLSQQEGKTYRLPTEAEWEYACRAGTTTRFSFGDSDASLGDYAWFRSWATSGYSRSVGQKKPNPCGLYDMHGNVWEWCSDWYKDDYYAEAPSDEPKGPSSGERRCLRGGSWLNNLSNLRCSYREGALPGIRNSLVGFRVVRANQEKTSREEAPSHPETSVDYFNRGKAYADKSKYDLAISDFDKAIEIDPKYAEAYNNRGNAYRGKGEYDRAISDFNKAIEINPGYAGAYLNRGVAYFAKGEYDRAISDYNKAIEINPQYAIAYVNRGAVYNDKGEHDKAISDYNKALEIDPGDAAAYCNRGDTYRSKGQYDRAISDLNKAIEINPGFAEAYVNRGIVYVSKDQYDQAISDFTKAIEINPRLALAYYNRGLAYDQKGKYDLAISDYSKAIEINPRYAPAYNNRGLAYAQKGEYDKALEDIRKAESLGLQIPPALLNALRKASGRRR